MAADLGALGAGIVATGGGLISNWLNRREGRDARKFAERMSSTAAQRAVADYRAAGLNPALAYDRPASAPGTSAVQLEDAVGKGVSSALAARQMQANVELTKAQTEKVQAEKSMIDTDLSIRTVSGDGEPSWRDQQIAKRVAELRDLAHQGRLQPHDERLRALAVMMQRAMLKGAQFRGGMFEDAQGVKDFIRAGVSSASGAAEAFKAWIGAGRAWSRQGVGLQVGRNAVPKSLRRKK